MTIIVEDGSIVPNSNSYTDLANARIVASVYGLSLPADDTEAEAALIIGQKWIIQQESTLQGSRLESSQSISYPRTPVELYGFLLDKNTIPSELIDSQVVVAVQQGISGDILASSIGATAPSVKKEKLEGVGETEYFEGGTSDSTSANIKLAISLLSPLAKSALVSSGGGYDVLRG